MSDFCYFESCPETAVEKCLSCGELYCEEHINNHKFCERIKKYEAAKKDILREFLKT